MPDGSRSFDSASAPDLDRVAVLFRAHFAFVRRVLRRCGIPEDELDDAVQEVFLVVHRRIDEFEGRASETTWLYAVAVRVASTLRRSARRERARRHRAGEAMHGAGEVNPELEVSRQEAGALLDRLLDELDTTKRTVFVLAELEGVPVPEIATIMDANVRTTHSRLRLARKRFDAALQRHHAQEQGRLARLELPALARRAAPPSPSSNQQRAAWAGVAAKIGSGASPMAVAWTGGLAAAAKGGAFWGPLLATLGVGTVALGGVALAVPEPEPAAVVSTAPRPERSTAPAPASPASPLAPPTFEAPAPQPEPAVEPVASPSTNAPRSKTRSRKPAPAPDPLEAETALLESARTQLRLGHATAALRLLRQHRSKFPSGLLAAERASTEVKALCALGRSEEATAMAEASASLQRVLATACR